MKTNFKARSLRQDASTCRSYDFSNDLFLRRGIAAALIPRLFGNSIPGDNARAPPAYKRIVASDGKGRDRTGDRRHPVLCRCQHDMLLERRTCPPGCAEVASRLFVLKTFSLASIWILPCIWSEITALHLWEYLLKLHCWWWCSCLPSIESLLYKFCTFRLWLPCLTSPDKFVVCTCLHLHSCWCLANIGFCAGSVKLSVLHPKSSQVQPWAPGQLLSSRNTEALLV